MHDGKSAKHKHGQRRAWRFNPYEIAVCGYKNSGKTTLLERLVAPLGRDDLHLAYLKHDAHHFSMDRPGKDTDRLRQAGVPFVAITGEAGFAHLGDRQDSDLLAPSPLLAADALLVEGYKQSDLPRMMLLDEALAIVDDPAWLTAGPVAAIHPWPSGSPAESAAREIVERRLGKLPWFSRDDIPGVADFIRVFWQRRVPPVQGLVLTGGHSTRMGRDKALLDYHGIAQLDYCVQLLSTLGVNVWVSCRPDQEQESARRRYPLLQDRFLGMGPMGGLLTALSSDAGAGQSWLVLACDLPAVSADVLASLLAARHPHRFATAFRDGDGLPEPLCAIWESKAYPRLLQFLGMGQACPRKCLIHSPTHLVAAPEPCALDNGNCPDDFERIRHDLDGRS
jgi:molybdopterin-guanine dinucleotide biosynthesis protein A